MMKYNNPTPYRISTITTTASVSAEVNLDILYEHLTITDGTTGITYLEFGKKKNETVYKGFAKKFLINRRRKKPSKRFDNQLTIVYKKNDITSINIKVFRNGNVQMTGVKNINEGSEMVDLLIDIIKNIHTIKNDVVSNIDDLKNSKYKIGLINTDFKIGFEIKRDNLFKVMINDFNNITSYEPCIYPGVKIQYFWNSENVIGERDGVCRCENKCFLKKKSGTGFGRDNCKKITLACFQSGAIIITGSQKTDQIEECYSFINKVLYENVDKIIKKQMTMQDENGIEQLVNNLSVTSSS